MHEKTFLAFFMVEHHVIREKGRMGKDQVVNFLRTDVPSSHYRDAIQKRLSLEEIDKKSRNLQDEIYYNRRSNPFILDWFYKRLHRKNEEFMNRGAEELVTEALHSLGKSGNP